MATMSTVVPLRKKVFARGVLATLGKSAISHSQFVSVCTCSERIPPSYRMTPTEVEAFLISLERAGAAVRVGEQQVHLRPVEIVDAVHFRAGLPRLSCQTPRRAADQKRLAATAEGGLVLYGQRLRQVVAKRKKFWAFTAALSGTQMTVLAYLQFQVFGWDVMEPVTYFVTTGTALIAYVYFLCFRREHSYKSVDDNLSPEILTQDLRLAEWVQVNKMAEELGESVASVEDAAAGLLAPAEGTRRAK